MTFQPCQVYTYATVHTYSLSFDQLSAHNLGATEVGSLKRLAEGHKQQSGAQTGSSFGASSGSMPVIEIGSGESSPHRPKEIAPSGGAVGNASSLQQIISSESGGAEAKGVIHDSPGHGSVIPLDNAWENKG